MATPHPEVLESLRLRRWSLALLNGEQLPPPPASAVGWTLFLAREGCAPRLLALAGTRAPTELRSAAAADAQIILLLRAELQAIMVVAARLGIVPVLLKGGAALHDGARAVRAKDIDLLLSPAEAHALASALDTDGWRPHGGGSRNHLAERVRDGGPPVELHTTDAAAGPHLSAAALARARPHPTLPGLRLLHPDDQVRHLAIHQTIEHAAYRGRLRDLLLLGDALADSSGDDLIEGWGLPPHQRAPVAEVIDVARALHDHRSPRDPFETIAAAWYLLDAEMTGRGTSGLRRLHAIWTFEYLVGGGAPGDHWRAAWDQRLDERSNLPLLGALGASHPAIGKVLRQGARAIYLPVLVASAKVNALRLRSRAATLVATLDHRT